MGGKVVLPEQDLLIQKVMKTYLFTPADISSFFKIFQRLDKAKTGFVPLVSTIYSLYFVDLI